MVFLLLSADESSANTVPTAGEIDSLAERVNQTSNTFMQRSLELRLRYEYSGKFLNPNDRQKLHRLAEETSERLRTIAKEQKEFRQKIEDYQGDDWDDKYGSTGLWRKLAADIYITTLCNCEIDFYLALASQQPQKDKLLHEILARVDSLSRTNSLPYLHLLKARVFALLAIADPAYIKSAKKELDTLCSQRDIKPSTAFRAAIERIKLLGEEQPDRLKTLTEELAQSRCAQDFELILSLAILQRRLNHPEALERIVHLWPQTKDFLGSLILSELAGAMETAQPTKQALTRISVFEAELAARAASKDHAPQHGQLLDCLSNTQKFQTPLIMYVAASQLADSSPPKAVDLLITSSRLQQQRKTDMLNMEPRTVAEQAAQLAYNSFAEGSLNCTIALEAFENYIAMAEEKINEDLEYLYSSVLNSCGRQTESKELLGKIANRPAGKWRNRARLDLIIQTAQQGPSKQQHRQLLTRLSSLITDRDENTSQIRAEAVATYCQLLLESGDKAHAQKVLQILADAENARVPNLNALKSKALRQLGRLEQAAKSLLRVSAANCCEHVDEAMQLLSEIIARIELWPNKAGDFSEFVTNCRKLAKMCVGCFDGPPQRKSQLLLAELTIFAADEDKLELAAAETLLRNLAQDSSVDDGRLLRCRARLFSRQGRFDQAAQLWARLAKMQKTAEPAHARRSWNWWRAKFYELYYWSKQPKTDKKNILHTVEVLENSFQNIPPFWAEKLNSLKESCAAGLSKARK